MRFLIDAQLPPALTPWLAAKGHPAQHVTDCGLEGAADRAVWDEAIRTSALIVTKDENFAMAGRSPFGGHAWSGSGSGTQPGARRSDSRSARPPAARTPARPVPLARVSEANIRAAAHKGSEYLKTQNDVVA
jgi:hypothetical protein